MKTALTRAAIGFGLLIGLPLLMMGLLCGKAWVAAQLQIASLGPAAPALDDAGYAFRDLNKNGALDVYEDARAPVEERVNDLLNQMTLEEKAGVMFIDFTPVGTNGHLANIPRINQFESLVFPLNAESVVGRKMNSFSILSTIEDPAAFARWHNAMQKMAERTRLGIPVTLASDPRHGRQYSSSVAIPAGAFSVWPDALGLAASDDETLVRRFADIARQEYRSVGIHVALHPTADLFTEPRWIRGSGTFGEDAESAAKMVGAYVAGMQGEGLGPQSVATMVKHFSGAGPQKNGDDAHFEYGKEQVYPGDNFEYHIIPFERGAFPAGAAQIMPYYGIPMGQTSEDVGFSFNKDIITGLLRGKYEFDGVICTDWGLISDTKLLGFFTLLPARAWGVEHLSAQGRMLKLLDAGIDQFGGEHIPGVLVKLVKDGKVAEARLDRSVRRILRDKFRLGLFDNPYVDVSKASQTVGRADFVAAGIDAQRRSLVLLKNGMLDGQPALPLTRGLKIYVENIDRGVAEKYAKVVETSDEADVAVIRLNAPYERQTGLAGRFIHAGDLDFKSPEKERILALIRKKPTIIALYLERPAVIPEIAEGAAGLIAEFGVGDQVVLDAVFGEFSPSGKLPVEMPSSMAAVRDQKEDVPYDSVNPVFLFGYGLTYDKLHTEAGSSIANSGSE